MSVRPDPFMTPLRASPARFACALEECTKQMIAEIEIPNLDRALRPGMYASCQSALEKKADAEQKCRLEGCAKPR